MTFIMVNYSQQKCHFSSVKFLAITNIFISLLSFSYTCGVLDHTGFFFCRLCIAVPTQRIVPSLREHRAKFTRTLSRPSKEALIVFSYSTSSDFSHSPNKFPFPTSRPNYTHTPSPAYSLYRYRGERLPVHHLTALRPRLLPVAV